MALRPGSLRYEVATRGITMAQARAERGERQGLSRRASLGHARPGEPTARALQEAERHPDRAPISALQESALAHARAIFSGDQSSPDGRHRFDDGAVRRKIAQVTDRETLNKMRTISKAEWKELARNQVPGNPFYYH